MQSNINFANHIDLALSCHNTKREVAMGLVQINGMMLQSLRKYADDKELVMCAVLNNPISIKYSSATMRADKEVVMCAVRANGLMLCFAEITLRGDAEVVAVAVAQMGMALIYASSACKYNEHLCSLAVAQCGQALRYAPAFVRGLLWVARIAVANDGLALEHCSPDVQDNAEVAWLAIYQNGLALEWVGAGLIDADDELVMCALIDKPCAIAFAPVWYRTNCKLLMRLCVLDARISSIIPACLVRGYSLEGMSVCARLF